MAEATIVQAVTDTESDIVKQTWSAATEKLGSTSNFGIAALDRMFTEDPELVKVFKTLRDIPAAELRNHVNFRAQGSKMANALQGIVENLDNEETELLLLQKLELAHVPRQLNQGHYEEFQRALVATLEATLGEEGFSAFAKVSWNKALTRVMSGIGKDQPPVATPGLKERERLIVQKAWKDGVAKFGGVSDFGIAAFNLLFTRHPEYTQLFKAFRQLPANDLSTSPELKAQATNVFAALNMVIENLGDSEFQELMHKKLGKDHIQRNIKQDNFEELQQVILILLERSLGQAFTPFARSSVDRALSSVVSGISQNL